MKAGTYPQKLKRVKGIVILQNLLNLTIETMKI